MKWLSLILLMIFLACSAPEPPIMPVVDTKGHIEERYYLGAEKNKFILTIAIYDVRPFSEEMEKRSIGVKKEYRMITAFQKKFDTYEQMIQEIKDRKDQLSKN